MSKDLTFRIGDCLVEQGLDRISRGEAVATVRPQVMDVLVYLAARGNKVVHTDDLLEDLWPGKVVTSASIYNCVSELRQAFLVCDKGRTYVETVPKRGYRLVPPIAMIGESATAPTESQIPATRPAGLRLAVLVAVSLSLTLSALLIRQSAVQVEEPRLGPASIVVLPFARHEDLESDIYADGLMSEILVGLYEVEGITTIGRTTAVHFPGSEKPVQEIAGELGVGAVMSGVLREAADRRRIDLELLKGNTGEIVWSESYDLPQDAEGVIRVASDIVQETALALQVEFIPAEAARIGDRHVPVESAYEHYLRGEDYDRRTLLEEAIEEHKKATIEDPYFAEAWAALAKVLAEANYMGLAPATMQQAEFALEHARRLAPRSADTMIAEAVLLANSNRFDESVEKLNRVMELRPGAVDPVFQLAGAYTVQLRLEEAREYAERAVLLDPLSIEAVWQLAFVLAWSWDFDDARIYYDRLSAREPDEPHGWRFWMRYGLYLWGLGDVVAAERILDDAPDTISTANEAIQLAYVRRDWNGVRALLASSEASDFTQHAFEARLHWIEGDTALQRASGELLRPVAENRLEELIRRDAPGIDVESARSSVAVALALAGNDIEAIRTIEIAVDNAASDPDRLNAVPVYYNEVLTYLFLGRSETAFERIRALFAWARPPYLTPHRLRMDPDFDALREFDGFVPLLEELEQATN